MPSADKRQRKKENARVAREAREAEVKKQRRNRTIRNGAIAAAVFVVAFLVLHFVTGKDNNKKDTSTTSTSEPTSTTVKTAAAKLPAGCVKTVPKTTTKPTNLKAPAMTIDPTKTYSATIETTCGNVTIALDAKNAPKSVNNFVSLARQGFYDGLKWHRVATNPPVIQGGDPKGDGSGGPGYSTVVELPPDGKYPTAAVAWAKGQNDPDGSASSQFFVDTGDATSIGNHYGYIGKVSAGADNVAKMATLVDPNSPNGAPKLPLYMFKVTINEQ